jgi:hypothetical protein
MREVTPEPELAALLTKYGADGGVLDFVFLEAETEGPPEQLHREAALAGMAAIDRRLEHWAIGHESEEYPLERFFRVRWDEAKLAGEQVSLSTFWGSDGVEPKRIGESAWLIPSVDGYKSGFFHPPHGLRGSSQEQVELFAGIGRLVLGEEPARAEIFSWSTDWSNYFEAGREWWGAFYWTIRPAGARRFAVVGASSTD